ncbi:MAG: hypothetical protein DRO09_00070 [Thermoprotei archaeon]|nr:MAG: hypothetical protein DRO09_00070 [Thermoprotei archaeon]
MKEFSILRLEFAQKLVKVYVDGKELCEFLFKEDSRAQLERLILQHILDFLSEYVVSELKEAEKSG